MSSESAEKSDNKLARFPVGVAAQRQLKKKLKKGTQKEFDIFVKAFQQANSLHSMMSTAFDTQPRYAASVADSSNVESLDTDSVLEFLSHLGVSHHQVHQRVSDTLLKQLEDEIRKTAEDGPLLVLLKDVWQLTTLLNQTQFRPLIWTILLKLGDRTPEAMLQALAERNPEDGGLKHETIYSNLPTLLHKLVWETDWTDRVPPVMDLEPKAYLEKVSETLVFQTMNPCIVQYCTNKKLMYAANIAFANSKRDRKVTTTNRRALTASAAAPSTTGTAALLRGKGAASSKSDEASSGNAIAKLRAFLKDESGSKLAYRPRLLYAVLSILMGQHGSKKETFLGGADFLQCTMVSDILLSAGGALPKSYDHVQKLAQTLDECVQEGNISDQAIIEIQKLIRKIFQPGMSDGGETESSTKKELDTSESAISNAAKRQLNRIVTECIDSLKENDPQIVFLNPVTDELVEGYSKVIKKPMCLLMMMDKVAKNAYQSIEDFGYDVKLMFNNCIKFNKGDRGRWFREEAKRQQSDFEKVFSQARKDYQTEVVSRKQEILSSQKRAVEEVLPLTPLPPSTKKRKKDHDNLTPSMPALASMLVADPFFVRIVLARVLKELRQGVINGESLPVAHRAVPSLLQFLHLARFSTQVCATGGKRFFVPGGGAVVSFGSQPDDPLNYVPFATLRNNLPLLLRLLVEAELDKRIISEGDLHEAYQLTSSLKPQPIDRDQWVVGDQMEVAVTLVEGALVYVCQPGNAHEESLSLTFERFADSLRHVAGALSDHRIFFNCLIVAILAHKAKLSRAARDTIVNCWLDWLRSIKTGCAVSAAHECFILLLTKWYGMGNLVLPRDTLLEICKKTVGVVDEAETSDENKFFKLWQVDNPSFAGVKKLYTKILKIIPSTNASAWKKEVGIPEDDGNVLSGSSQQEDTKMEEQDGA